MQTDQKNTHILLTTSWMPSANHPFLGNFVVQFAREAAKSIRVTFLLLSPSKNTTISLETTNEKNLQILKVNYPQHSKIRGQRKALKVAANYLQHQNIHLIHHHVSLTKWWIPIYFKRKLQCPIVVTEHASVFLNGKFEQLSPLMKFGVKRLYNSAQAIVAVSEQLKKKLPLSQTTKMVIPNLLLEDWLVQKTTTPSHTPYRFLHVSTVDANKRADGIIRAFHSAIHISDKPAELTIVSDESTEVLQTLCKTLNLSESVHFIGPTKHKDLQAIYQAHHCFVLNSEVETFSIVSAEALACGLHLITTPVGFAAEFTSKSCIDLVAGDTPEELTDTMVTAIQQRKFGGNASRSLVQHFGATEVIQQYLRLYQTTISAHQP